MEAHERTAISTRLHPPKALERFTDDVYSQTFALGNLFPSRQQYSSKY